MEVMMGDIGCHLTLSQSRNRMLRKFAALASLLSILFLNGCMAGKTRSLPFTEYPPSSTDIAYLKKATIAVQPFDISSTVFTGGHHEGLMQVRQPGIWGLSTEQQKILYGDLGNIVRYAFIDELMKRNQRVIILGQSFPTRKPDYTVSGVVRSVELNTYGQGTREGFGTAGNYWEATVELADVAIIRSSDNAAVWRGDMTEYCKLADSPAKLDWTIFTVLQKSLQEGLALSKGITPGGVQEAIEISAASYEVGPVQKTPVEIASRLAALDVLKRIFGSDK
jgi:hypothetical protein